MLSVGERDASVVRTGPKSSAIITAPGEKCGLVCWVANSFVFAVAHFRRWQGASDEQW